MTLSTSDLTKLALEAYDESHEEQTTKIVEGIQTLQVYATVSKSRFENSSDSPFAHFDLFAKRVRELLEILEA